MIGFIVAMTAGLVFMTALMCLMSGRPGKVLRSALRSKWTIVTLLIGVLMGACFLAIHLWEGPIGYERVVAAPPLPIFIGWVLQLAVAVRDVRRDEGAPERDRGGGPDIC